MTRHAPPKRERGWRRWFRLAWFAGVVVSCALTSQANAQTVTTPGVAPLAVNSDSLTSCSPKRNSEGFFGVYRSDAWPRGNIVLTFDDGPHIVNTKRVLNLLARYQLPATFFLVGRAINSRTFPLVQRIVAEGHLIGSHSYNHDVFMAFENGGESTVEYIRGQHEVTQILVELALMADSAEDFSTMYSEVFGQSEWKPLTRPLLQDRWPSFVEHHRALLDRRGLTGALRPYRILYSRPPGGGPYLSASQIASARRYDQALERLGWLNILWHGGSRDTDAIHGKEFGFLLSNMRYMSRHGGVLLMHDAIRPDALNQALAGIASSPGIEVVSLDRAIRRKFGCDERELRQKLSSIALP